MYILLIVQRDKCLKYLFRATDIAKLAYGDEHIWTAEIYLDVALLYYEDKSSQLASTWIRKSFVACYKAVGIKHKALKAIYKHLMSIEADIDSVLCNVPIDQVMPKLDQICY